MKRGLAALVGVSAALALGACGDDDTDVTIPDLDEATLPDVTGVETPDVSVDFTTPDVSVDFTVPDISLPSDLSLPEDVEEAIRTAFPDLDDAQVDCLVESASGQDVSIDSIMDLADQCNIELQDLIPGG